jgi:hypothetical protein
MRWPRGLEAQDTGDQVVMVETKGVWVPGTNTGGERRWDAIGRPSAPTSPSSATLDLPLALWSKPLAVMNVYGNAKA